MSDALMVTSSFLPGRGGIESYLAELCQLVAPRLDVLAPGERDGIPLPSDLPYGTFPGPGKMLAPTGRVTEATLEAARTSGTTKVLFGTPWPLGLIGPKLATQGLRYAAIVHASEMLVPAAIPVVGGRLARALAGAEVLFAVSDFTADQIRHVLTRHDEPVPAIERLRARVDLQRFRPDAGRDEMRARLGIGPKDHAILCFGRLVRRKGVHRLLAAADEIEARVGNTVIVVAGTGPELGRLRRTAARIGTKVVFAGRVPEADAPAVYAAADVFALPVVDRFFGLETEGLGVVLLEASASGVPCVTGRSGGTPEAVVDGVTGSVIDASDRARLVEAVVGLLSDPETGRAMGVAGRGYVKMHYSADQEPLALLNWLDG